MKAVFFNHCHPAVTHVCGLRAGRLAASMAARGHRIVLVTGSSPDGADEVPVRDLSAALAAHDWSTPFRLACPPISDGSGSDMAAAARDGRLVAGPRHAVIAWSYLVAGGMFADWQAGVGRYLPALAEAFAPDVIWGTFGNTDTWKLCQKLARAADCPWVGDFKDNWSAFLPIGFRTLMAARFKDAAAMTVLSMAHCDQADALFPMIRKTVLYSGVETVGAAAPPKIGGNLELTLTGSIYDAAKLNGLMAAVARWAAARGPGAVLLQYAGNDGKRVQAAAAAAGVAVTCEGYMSQESLHALQAAASANLYIHDPRCLMHHKALELIAAGRPVISYPGETGEVRGLAAEAGATLFACADAAAIGGALDVIADDPPPVPEREMRAAFTWTARAAALEHALVEVLSRRSGGA